MNAASHDAPLPPGGDPCERVGEALPWLVNGTLSRQARDQAEIHIAACPRCSRLLAVERRIAESMRAPQGNVTHAPQSGWRAFEARLDAEAATATVPASVSAVSTASVGASRRVRRSPVLWWVVAAQAAAITGLAVVLVLRETASRAPDFATVSTSTTHTPTTRDVSAIDVAAAAAADAATADSALADANPRSSPVRLTLEPSPATPNEAATVAALARAIGADLVAGPLADGSYTLSLNTRAPDVTSIDSAGDAALNSALDWLRAQPGVRGAERLDAATTGPGGPALPTPAVKP